MNPQITPPPQGGYAYPCPVCHQQAAFDYDELKPNSTRNSHDSITVLILLLGICFWPLLIIGVLGLVLRFAYPSTEKAGTTRRCHSCGHAWRVS